MRSLRHVRALAGHVLRGRRRWWLGVGAAALALTVYLVAPLPGAGRAIVSKPPARAVERPVSVAIAPVRTRDMSVALSGLGSVTPLNTVTVKSRVDGQLMRVRFEEGQLVAAGDVLAEIDPRPFEVQLTQAQGQLIRDQALLRNALVDLDRYKVLVQQDSAPQQQYATQESLVRQYEGVVETDQGQVDSAKLNLTYCRITAPIGGRVGLRLVDPGNIVHASDTGGIVVITQLQPIGVLFTLPEDSIPSVFDRLGHGGRLAVQAYDREQQHKLADGSLLTVDNQIDQTTGTVRLKAVFPNTDRRLFANQFVNVRVVLDVERGALVVPAAAIQRSPRGAFVYVVTPQSTVANRPVTVGVSDGDDVAVTAGLSATDRVVVDGADRLRDGSKVEAQLARAA